jgi:hypothetical protein
MNTDIDNMPIDEHEILINNNDTLINNNDTLINKPQTQLLELNYYQRNKEKIKARRAEYVKNNPDKIKEANKRNYNKQYFKEYYHKKKLVEVPII